MTEKHTLVALVENEPGVLMRVTNMFRKRNFNIDSLTVGRTHRSHISRMTIVVDSTRANAYKIMSNLLKLIPVIDVAQVSADLHVRRAPTMPTRAIN
jgi:acetolactate synthase I/III small subunit